MSEEWLEIEHARLGRLRLRAEHLLRFDGIPGFPAARRFALIEHDGPSGFAWLACCDDLDLALPIVPLRAVAPEQWSALGPDQLSAVAATDREEIEAFAIVNMRGDPPQANVEAPLLVHTQTRHGAQIFLPMSDTVAS